MQNRSEVVSISPEEYPSVTNVEREPDDTLSAMSTVYTPLLTQNGSDVSDEEDGSDGRIVSQLLSQQSRRSNHRCCRRSRRWFAALVLCACAGFSFSTIAATSCDAVLVEWRGGDDGATFSVDAVGVRRFRRGAERSKEGGMAHEVCIPYGGEGDGFFPVDPGLRVCSLLAPILAGLATVAILLLDRVADFERTASTTSRWWWRIESSRRIIAMTALVGGTLLASGALQLVTILGLLHFSRRDEETHSPVCDPRYSSCRLGPGGIWASLAIACFFVVGSILSVASFASGWAAFRNRGRR